MYCSCTGHIFTVMSHLRERLVWNAWGLKERSTPALEEPGIVQWMFTFEQSERIEACLRRSGAVSSSSSRPSHTKEHLPCRSQTLTICAGKSGWGHGPFPKSLWIDCKWQTTVVHSWRIFVLRDMFYVASWMLWHFVTCCGCTTLYLSGSFSIGALPGLCHQSPAQTVASSLCLKSSMVTLCYTATPIKGLRAPIQLWIYSLMTLLSNLSNLSILDSMRLRLLRFKPNLSHCTIRGQTKTHWWDAGQVVLWAASKALSKLRMLMSSKQNQSSTCCSPALLHHTNACRRLQVPKPSLATS